MTRLPALVLILAFLGSAWFLFVGQAPEPERDIFYHELHEGLFPTCTACHGSVGEEDGEAFSVAQEDCARCHDGDIMDEVVWRVPPDPPSNLFFDHALHVTDMEIPCLDCHEAEGATERMEVVRVRREVCFDCHGIDDHFAEADLCADCHAPVIESSFTTNELAGLPKPEDHEDPGFVWTHGEGAREEAARCATCHARNTCDACHINGDQLPAVSALDRDERFADLESGVEPRWPVPESHQTSSWSTDHAAAFEASGTACANCHVQSGCRECHSGEGELSGLDVLPQASAGDSRGVRLPDAHPPLHGADFGNDHAVAAATQALECGTCHSSFFCEDCHNAASRPGFHPVNYVLRHGADANAQDLDCASCHSTEVFCRSCHMETGRSSGDVRSGAYHDTQPLWLLSHGQAARQGMETCASCHQQNDCLKCHSAKTGWSINPHGPDFDAERMADKSPLLCSRCHFDLPTR